MSNIPNLSNSVNQRQAVATNPELSIWVSANAGSGKTYVLSRRVIRLLLQGNKPSELLCLTFTKAAAAEMSNRVFKILGEWTMMPDDKLSDAIAELTGNTAYSKDLVRARKLFAIALDTPGGLRIQTIHAFCESLLHQFPLEANIPGHFEMMDDLEQQTLIEEAKRSVILKSLGELSGISKGHEDELHFSKVLPEAFATIREHASDMAIDDAISQLIHNREDFNEWVRRGGGDVATAFKAAWDNFSLTPDNSSEKLYKEFSEQTSYAEGDIENLLSLASTKTAAGYQKLVEQINFIRHCKDSKIQHEKRCEICLTGKQEPRKALVHKTFLENEPHQLSLFEAEQELLISQLNRLKTLDALKASQALFSVAEAILLEYARLKQKRSRLDFSDLISKTANLLGRNEISAWVQYKLDSGISHVLVDEAQDTSPLQWKIIEAITSEFYAGKGTKEKIRTVFVVGDEKQSIYSFQGADPKEFYEQYRNLIKKSENAQLGFKRVALNMSFRSTQEVLSAVDQVFSLPENSKGLNELGENQSHSANRISDRGEVILWPQELKPKRVEKTDWRKPPGEPSETDAEIRLANKIAQTIKYWIDTEEKLPGRDKPIQFGDILILVRKRDRFVSAINRALKQKGLVSAGADRLKLTEHIAIEDMIALGRFASMQMDDLSLAGILKSPLFDFSEEDLFTVCHDRQKKSLFAHLISLSTDNNALKLTSSLKDKLNETVTVLRVIRKDASRLPVYEFFARLFAKTNLRQKYHARLGHEVEEILDGFFQAAMNYDNRSGLGLQGFIETMISSKPELKREIDMDANEIRVITTHSSKGLEAPIVFLVDPSNKAYDTRHAPAIINFRSQEGKEIYLWQAKKSNPIKETVPIYEAIEEANEEEYRRLLYVAMTRAADRLIVCGYRNEEPPKHPHWYQMIEDGLNAPRIDPKLEGQLKEVPLPVLNTLGRQWVIKNVDYKKKDLKKSEDTVVSSHIDLPDWLKPTPQEPSPPRPLSPSGVLDLLEISEDKDTEIFTNSVSAMERGNAVHHLLQILPDVEPSQRSSIIEAYFGSSGFTFSDQNKSEIATMVRDLLNQPENSWLFSPESKTEVDIAGQIRISNKTHMVRGKIDRLIVKDDVVTIVDYKTNRIVPIKANEVSSEYLAQMALYRELLRDMYPNRQVECLLVWTQNASMMKIEDRLLDEQIARITSGPQQVVSDGSLT